MYHIVILESRSENKKWTNKLKTSKNYFLLKVGKIKFTKITATYHDSKCSDPFSVCSDMTDEANVIIDVVFA